ncbi:MAG TPA: YidC/Oxa1 family membrane protein insertase [Candidatus Paceibacterota bacterium]|nr:YidC/Oxa1 family membrane protein insertase [Candidatus Paceibacterota bacterium]
MIWFFQAVFYKPLYNGLILLLNAIPGADIGIAVIVFTIIVKLILFPLTYKSIKTQIQMKRFEPELAKIREKYTDKQEQALKVMEVYKQAGINPFASFFLVLIQLPILISLYYVFLHSGLPTINPDLIYPFVHANRPIAMELFGLMDLSKSSIVISLLAAVATFFQMKYSASTMGSTGVRKPNASFTDDLARTMTTQMKYVYPVFIFIIAYRLSGAVALYWLVNTLFTLAQELYARRRIGRNHPPEAEVAK